MNLRSLKQIQDTANCTVSIAALALQQFPHDTKAATALAQRLEQRPQLLPSREGIRSLYPAVQAQARPHDAFIRWRITKAYTQAPSLLVTQTLTRCNWDVDQAIISLS